MTACNAGTHNDGMGGCAANAGGRRRMSRKAGRKGSKKSMRKNLGGGKRRAATRKGRKGSRKSRSSRR